MNYYLVGIKGTGMSAVAVILKSLGNYVKGSDKSDYYFTEESLIKNNIEYELFNDNISSDYIYIISSAYDKNNICVNKIIENGYEYYYYHDFINNYFKGIKIGVCGSHGKTTTTSIITKLFEDEKICALIGDGTGIGNVNYNYFIFEACEYKEHFLNYTYDYLIITNIDYDHPDYFKNECEYINAFNKVSKLSKCLICNGDDENIKKINHQNKITYGFNYDNDYVIEKVNKYNNGYIINIVSSKTTQKLYIPLFGLHNIMNVLSAIVLIYELGLDINIQKKIYKYNLPKRRMDEKIYKSNIIITDYAHHPTEIKSLLSAIKEKYNKDIIVIFQPHTYSRTLILKDDFKLCFQDAYKLYLMNTFTSREEFNIEKENEVIRIFKESYSMCELYNDSIMNALKNGKNKVILLLGAGNIDSKMKEFM